MTALNANQKIRNAIKLRRSKLSNQELNNAARNISRQFIHNKNYFNSKTVASYIASNGEISIHKAIGQMPNADVFLPRITNMRRASMSFYSSQNKLIRNRFNIVEPLAKGVPIDIRNIDLILIPLVAFDRDGNRIGMGGGFYDRALSFRSKRSSRTRPRLVGVAHHFQEITSITPQPWDVHLDAILTDRELIKVSN